MMLVDIDAEIDRVCNEICGCGREQCRWKAYGEEEGCNQIQELEKAKAVDAIPMGWLRSVHENWLLTPDEMEFRDWLIERWQKEQEGV